MIFYTTGSGDNAEGNSDESLGGFISKTQVGKVFKDNDYSPVTYRLIAIKNIFQESKSVVISVIQDEVSDYKIETSLAPIFKNSCEQLYFEQIPTPSSKPLQFLPATEISVSEFKGGEFLGIWLKKSLKELGKQKGFKQFIDWEEIEELEEKVGFGKGDILEENFGLKILMLPL